MKVLVLSNGVFEEKEIENTLKALQEIVGGWIEIPFISEKLYEEGIDIIINEEGKLIGLEPQIAIVQKGKNKILDLVMGNCIFASHDEEGNTIGLNDRQIKVIEEELKYETFISYGGMAMVKVLFI